jgi:hypothetical protein
MKTVVARFLPVVAIAAAIIPLASGAAPNPITIQQCFITVPNHFSTKASGTQIVYVNRGPKTAHDVTFAVGYRNAQHNFLRRVTDTGEFGPGVPINHHFSLFSDVTFAGKTTSMCKAIAVKWSDGTSWHS